MIYVCIPYTPGREERLQKTIESVEKSTSIPYTLVTYKNDFEGWPKAVHNMLAGIKDDALVFLVSTDSIVYPGCLEKLVEAHAKQFPTSWGMVEPYNELHAESMAQHPFGQAGLFREVISTAYIHCFADVEMTERAKERNQLVYVPEAKIEHQHIVNKKAEMDAGYQFSMNQENLAIDRETFKRRKDAHWI